MDTIEQVAGCHLIRGIAFYLLCISISLSLIHVHLIHVDHHIILCLSASLKMTELVVMGECDEGLRLHKSGGLCWRRGLYDDGRKEYHWFKQIQLWSACWCDSLWEMCIPQSHTHTHILPVILSFFFLYMLKCFHPKKKSYTLFSEDRLTLLHR